MMMKVKPLVWDDWSSASRERFDAPTRFGAYIIMQMHFPEMHYKVETPTRKILRASTLDLAKGIAQDHYERGIMAALEPDTDLSAALIKAALEWAAGLCNKSILNGGMAQSVAMFVEVDHHKIYRDAAENYAEKISKIANDPSEIDSIIKQVMGE